MLRVDEGVPDPQAPTFARIEQSAGGGRAQFELPHFKESFARAGAPLYGGAWGYWMDIAESDL